MSELNKFIIVNKVEGYSYLILLFIAMPLKYMYQYPLATKVAGAIHGILFCLFIYQLLKTTETTKLSAKEVLLFFILSLIPFGSFYIQKLCLKKV